jgi:hypothetical protein
MNHRKRPGSGRELRAWIGTHMVPGLGSVSDPHSLAPSVGSSVQDIAIMITDTGVHLNWPLGMSGFAVFFWKRDESYHLRRTP